MSGRERMAGSGLLPRLPTPNMPILIRSLGTAAVVVLSLPTSS